MEEERELVPFPDAVWRIYEQINGCFLSPFGGPLIDALLNEVAQAIVDLGTIYGRPTPRRSQACALD
jgi:hypothetical protein